MWRGPATSRDRRSSQFCLGYLVVTPTQAPEHAAANDQGRKDEPKSLSASVELAG